jgi:hypothetical protein
VSRRLVFAQDESINFVVIPGASSISSRNPRRMIPQLARMDVSRDISRLSGYKCRGYLGTIHSPGFFFSFSIIVRTIKRNTFDVNQSLSSFTLLVSFSGSSSPTRPPRRRGARLNFGGATSHTNLKNICLLPASTFNNTVLQHSAANQLRW